MFVYKAAGRPGSIFCLSFGLHSWRSPCCDKAECRKGPENPVPKKASLSLFRWGGKKGSVKPPRASLLWLWRTTFRHESCSHHPNMTNTCILPKHRHTVMRQLSVLAGTVLFPFIFFLKCNFAVSHYYKCVLHSTHGCLGILSRAGSKAKGWSASCKH